MIEIPLKSKLYIKFNGFDDEFSLAQQNGLHVNQPQQLAYKLGDLTDD